MSNWITITQTKDFIIDYDKTTNMYRVSYFQDNHFVDDIIFNAYDNSASQDGLMGWICPKCGAVMSPFQPCCVKCSSNFEITYSGTGTPPPQTYCTLECNEDYNIALLG